MKTARHYCPSCGAGLVSEPINTPLRCKRCDWHLITLEEWQTMKPFTQGYVLYGQGSWPTSELAAVENPYAKGTAKWTAFRDGEQRATMDAQDGEE